MKKILFGFLPLFLSACISNSPAPDSSAKSSEPNMSLLAFEEVCIKTAPSFSNAKSAAAKFGITDIEDMGFTNIGMAKDKSIGVQIKPNNECVITTPTQKNSTLTRDFLQLVSRSTKTPPSNRTPTTARINGATFIFQHDRSGGEAFVMLKING